MVRADAKVWVKDGFAFGFTSSFRMGNLLRYRFKAPYHMPDKDVMEYLVVDFVDALRGCLKDGGFATKDCEQEIGGTFLLGYKGRLFRICEDYQVGETVTGYDACGSGEEIARGALYATKTLDPQDRIRLALEAAEANQAFVCAPFNTVEV